MGTMSSESLFSSIAVLMTCHNRRDITLTCLANLAEQSLPLTVYLVDDGSIDGTTEAVQAKYPEVKLLPGNGNLFWVGGMRLAFATAMQSGHDYYLWLNDDTHIQPDALQILLTHHQHLVAEGMPETIVVGSTQDPSTGKPTYGGAIRTKAWYSNKFEFVEPTNQLQPCDTFFGNCVLIPQAVAQKVGNIDSAFIHTLGDLDYGLRAQKAGCSVWAAPGYIATCSQNTVSGSWADTQLSLIQRLRKAIQIKGFPIKPWTTFNQRHAGPLWFLYWCLPYIRAVVGYRSLASSNFAGAVQEDKSLLPRRD
jgi:GT2 family glycosyltransferase